MKTKCQFSPSDFKGAGQIVVRDSFERGSKDCSHGLIVAYKVGWLSGESCESKYCLVSLADGMVIRLGSIKDLCAYLNNDEIGFRPLELNELLEITKHGGNRF